MGIPIPFKNWAEVVSPVKAAISAKIEKGIEKTKEAKQALKPHPLPQRHKRPSPKDAINTNKPRTAFSRHSFRGARRIKPKDLKQKAYIEASITTLRK